MTLGDVRFVRIVRSLLSIFASASRVTTRGTSVRGDTATHHRSKSQNRVGPSIGRRRRRRRYRRHHRLRSRFGRRHRRRCRFGTRLVNENRSRIIWVRGHQPRRTFAEFKRGARRRVLISQSRSSDRHRDALADNASVIKEVGRGPCRRPFVPARPAPAVNAPFE